MYFLLYSNSQSDPHFLQFLLLNTSRLKRSLLGLFRSLKAKDFISQDIS